MSWTDEEIDGVVQQAAGELKVAYKDDYWKEMETMLGEPKKRRGIVWWWFGGVAALVVGFFAVYPFSGTNRQDVRFAQNTATGDELLSSTQISAASQEQATESHSTTAEATSVGEGENKFSKSTPAFTPEETASQNDDQPRTHRSVNSTFSKQATNDFPELAAESNTETLASAGPSNETKLEEVLTSTDSPNKDLIEIGSLSMRNWNVEQTGFALASPDPMLPVFPRKRLGFYAAAYGGVGQSYVQTSQNNYLYQMGFDAGVEWFQQRWSFAAGFGLREQFVSNLHISKRQNYYSFGLVSVDQNIEYDRIVFVDVPVSASYIFGKSTFGIQITPTYTAGARLSYTSEIQEQAGGENVLSSDSEKHEFVSSPNFASFGLNGGVMYGYNLFERVYIEAKVSSRLAPALLTDDFSGAQRSVPVMVELGLKKRF